MAVGKVGGGSPSGGNAIAQSDQRLSCRRGIACQPKQGRDLPRIGAHVCQHAPKSDRSRLIQRNGCSGRQVTLRRITDRPHHREWHPTPSGNHSDRAAFQIDRMGAGAAVQVPLHRGIGCDRVLGQKHMTGWAAKQGHQAGISLEAAAAVKHAGGNDHLPRPQRRMQATRQPETDETTRPACNQPVRGRFCPGGFAATDGHRPAQAARDPGLCGQADDDPWDQNPTSTRRVLPRIRLR